MHRDHRSNHAELVEGLEVSVLPHLSQVNLHLFSFTFVVLGDPVQGLLHARQVLDH